MRKRRQLLISDDAVPSDKQHKKPCSDCPWARTALRGWLGPHTADEWLAIVHSDMEITCHTIEGPQCAGAAIYRTNVCKVPRDRAVLTLPANREKVFATPAQFKDHHSPEQTQ